MTNSTNNLNWKRVMGTVLFTALFILVGYATIYLVISGHPQAATGIVFIDFCVLYAIGQAYGE